MNLREKLVAVTQGKPSGLTAPEADRLLKMMDAAHLLSACWSCYDENPEAQDEMYVASCCFCGHEMGE